MITKASEISDATNRQSAGTKGRLTVFLGAAPGVGKTYKMLETARQRTEDGADVVIGWIDSHGNPVIEQLASALARVKPREFPHQGALVREMDIDAIIKRKPELVLVDDLAHPNIPGSRHARRYQDVVEFLQSGIDVYSTINIQSIESLNDIVSQITGITVKDTVPDYILQQADSLQLIDIPPQELLKRINEGKAYVDQQNKELKQLFRSGNITALRELALRYTAKSVDEELSEYMKAHKINGPWPAASRIMVCVSASPFSSQLIRAARRLADGMHSELIAVHVETTTGTLMEGEERQRIAKNMRLAEKLKATTLTVVGNDLHHEILEVASHYNVTAIVVGKPRHTRLLDVFRGTLVDKLTRNNNGSNIYVIQSPEEEQKISKGATAPSLKSRHNWRQYAGGILMTGIVTGISWYFTKQLQPVNIALLYLMPVLLSAVWWGRWPSYLTAFVSVLLFDFLFVPPIFTFTVEDLPYAWSLLIFLLVSFLIGGRTELLRLEALTAYKRERITRSLYEFSREIASIKDPSAIAQLLAAHVAETIGRKAIVFLPNREGKLTLHGCYNPANNDSQDDEDSDFEQDVIVAQWTYEHGQPAGCSTDTFSETEFIHVPLFSRGSAVGVMSMRILGKPVTPEEQRCIDAWASLAAISVERVRLWEAAREAAMLVETEKLRTALFNSISHELRTPLSSISGAVSTLLESSGVYNQAERRELLEAIHEGSSRMDRIIVNLLDSARLESGMMSLKADWVDVEDLIGSAIRQYCKKGKNLVFNVDLPSHLPLVQADFVLMEQVLVNLFDNAIKFSPPGSAIHVGAKTEEGKLVVFVLDRGAGIPPDDLERVFDKFYRARQNCPVPGTGLGLSICKGIVEAHDGSIWAENRDGGGTAIFICLPNHKSAPVLEEEGEGD